MTRSTGRRIRRVICLMTVASFILQSAAPAYPLAVSHSRDKLAAPSLCLNEPVSPESAAYGKKVLNDAALLGCAAAVGDLLLGPDGDDGIPLKYLPQVFGQELRGIDHRMNLDAVVAYAVRSGDIVGIDRDETVPRDAVITVPYSSPVDNEPCRIAIALKDNRAMDDLPGAGLIWADRYIIKELPAIVVERDAAERRDWDPIFHRTAPLEVEIGFKYGEYLRHMAGSRPESNFVGIELSARRPYSAALEREIDEAGLGNVKLFYGDAKSDIGRTFAPGSVSAVHMKFPNTAPGYTLLENQAFMDSIFRILRPGGEVFIDTEILPDDADKGSHAERWKKAFRHAGFICASDARYGNSEIPEAIFITHDGSELTKLGADVESMRFVKPGGSSSMEAVAAPLENIASVQHRPVKTFVPELTRQFEMIPPGTFNIGNVESAEYDTQDKNVRVSVSDSNSSIYPRNILVTAFDKSNMKDGDAAWASFSVFTDADGYVLKVNPSFGGRDYHSLTRTMFSLIMSETGFDAANPALAEYLRKQYALIKPSELRMNKELMSRATVRIDVYDEIFSRALSGGEVTAHEKDVMVGGLLDMLNVKSQEIRRLALSYLRKLSAAGWIDEKEHNMVYEYAIREDIEEDLRYIERKLRNNPFFVNTTIRNIFGVALGDDELSIAKFDVSYFARGGNKQIYTVDMEIPGGRYRFAITTIRDSPPYITPAGYSLGQGDFSKQATTDAMRVWQTLMSRGCDKVARLGDNDFWLEDWQPKQLILPTGEKVWISNNVLLVSREFVEGEPLNVILESESYTDDQKKAAVEAAIRIYTDIWHETRDDSGKGIFDRTPRPEDIALKPDGDTFTGKVFDMETMEDGYDREKVLAALRSYKVYPDDSLKRYVDGPAAESTGEPYDGKYLSPAAGEAPRVIYYSDDSKAFMEREFPGIERALSDKDALDGLLQGLFSERSQGMSTNYAVYHGQMDDPADTPFIYSGRNGLWKERSGARWSSFTQAFRRHIAYNGKRAIVFKVPGESVYKKALVEDGNFEVARHMHDVYGRESRVLKPVCIVMMPEGVYNNYPWEGPVSYTRRYPRRVVIYEYQDGIRFDTISSQNIGYLAKKRKMSELQFAEDLCRQMFEIAAKIHDLGYVSVRIGGDNRPHCDLIPGNFQYNMDGKVISVSDFGSIDENLGRPLELAERMDDMRYLIRMSAELFPMVGAERMRALAEEVAKGRSSGIEAEGLVASVILKAREAKREGKKFIIGLETDWIPDMDKRGVGSQHDAINELMQEIERLPGKLRSMGLDNVELIHSGSADLARDLLEAIGDVDGFNNMVVLASKDTIYSKSFAEFRGADNLKKPFLAGIDDEFIKKAVEDARKKEGMFIPKIDILDLLLTTLDLALGKDPPPGDLITFYDRDNKIAVYLPKPEILPYQEAITNYLAKKTALESA